MRSLLAHYRTLAYCNLMTGMRMVSSTSATRGRTHSAHDEEIEAVVARFRVPSPQCAAFGADSHVETG